MKLKTILGAVGRAVKPRAIIVNSLQALGIVVIAGGVGMVDRAAGVITLGVGMVAFGVALELGN